MDRERKSVLAGEYVLGLLDPAERRAVERDLAGDADLRADLAFWEERLLALVDPVPAEVPPARVYARIEARLFGTPDPAWRARLPALWSELAAPGNRGLLAAVLLVKAALLVLLLYVLF
ncbi:hypothetical protein [Roseivivax isoporae]|nr:hypothetical protein [Roseivivax isoporae]